jgi:hypothetical protein
MLILSLFWLLIGLLIGALASAAKLRPTAWGRGGRLGMLGLGALVQLGVNNSMVYAIKAFPW